MKVDDARFIDGILTIALRREIPEADRPQKISIQNGPKKIAKAAGHYWLFAKALEKDAARYM